MVAVIMIEMRLSGDELTGEVSQIFGPFPDGDVAEKWAKRMQAVFGNLRQWAILPLSDPNVVLKLDVRSN